MNRVLKNALVATVAALAFGGPAAADDVELTLWSHWSAEQPKRGFVEAAIEEFEAANPGVTINVTWYEKNALYAALKTALRAGQAPDMFYAEPDQVEYIDNGFLLDLSKLDWSRVEPWARAAWTHDGIPYGLPLEAWTVELYYNKDKLADLGVALPESAQLSAEAFADLVDKAKAEGLTPMSLGVGDRPFPGAHLYHEALLKRLGVAEYGQLLAGELAWSDPRVVETLEWMTGLATGGMLPPTFSTMKLTEAHIYFHTKPGALMFVNGSWYTSRAFNTPDAGGQPEGFPLGIMKFPKVPGAVCNDCRTIAVGGSYVGNADSEHPDKILDFFGSFLRPEVGNRWLEAVKVQTGIIADPASIADARAADYFSMIATTNKGGEYFFGLPIQVMGGKPKEVFTQVINAALPAGNISVADAVKELDAAY